jgi:hypothetical protein
MGDATQYVAGEGDRPVSEGSNIFDWIAMWQRDKLIREQREQTVLMEDQIAMMEVPEEDRAEVLRERRRAREQAAEELGRLAAFILLAGMIVLIVAVGVSAVNHQGGSPAAQTQQAKLPVPPLPPKGARP